MEGSSSSDEHGAELEEAKTHLPTDTKEIQKQAMFDDTHRPQLSSRRLREESKRRSLTLVSGLTRSSLVGTV